MWTIIKAMGDLTFDKKNRVIAILITTVLIFCSIFSSTLIEYIKKDEERNDYIMLYYIFYFVGILIFSTLLILMFSRSTKHLKDEEKEKELKQQFKDELENVKKYLETIKKSETIEEYEEEKTYFDIKTRSYLTCAKFELKENKDDYFIVIIVEQNDEEIHTDCFKIKKLKKESKIIL